MLQPTYPIAARNPRAAQNHSLNATRSYSTISGNRANSDCLTAGGLLRPQQMASNTGMMLANNLVTLFFVEV